MKHVYGEVVRREGRRNLREDGVLLGLSTERYRVGGGGDRDIGSRPMIW